MFEIFQLLAQIPSVIVSKDTHGFTNIILGVLVILVILFILMFGVWYTGFYMANYWRQLITQYVQQKYISCKIYYNLNCIDKTIDNP